MITGALKCLRVVMACAAIATVVQAYVLMEGPSWSGGTVNLRLRLGTSRTFSDGTTPNSTAQIAGQVWNPYMGRLQLTATPTAAGEGTGDNSVNEVFFSSTIYGYAFSEDVLAVTLVRNNTAVRTEADVIVNQGQAWDSYRGPLRATTTDLRRVLVHEFGHVLGLGHPDVAGESVNSIMNAYVGGVEVPTSDDQDGVASLYGRGPGNPAVAPRIASEQPFDWESTEGQFAQFSIEVSAGSRPLRFQWRRNGVNLPGANDWIFEIREVAASDAGRYSVEVSNEAGTVTSREATLTVRPASKPFFNRSDSVIQFYLGQVIELQALAGGSDPLHYQWLKNGVEIAGATNERFSFYPAKASDAGDYTVRVSNVAGSAVSPRYMVMVLPVPPPPVVPAIISLNATSGDRVGVSPYYASGPYRYQWYRDGTPIPEATRSDYEIPSSSGPADYFAVITNEGGSTPSLAASYVPARPPVPENSFGWLAVERQAGIAYFLFDAPSRIERYDLTHAAWLSPIGLSRRPATFAVDASGIYMASGASVSRLTLAGTGETTILTTDSDVQGLVLANGFLYVFAPVPTPYTSYGDGRFLALRLRDLQLTDSLLNSSWGWNPGSFAAARDGRAIFGRDFRSSDGFLLRLSLNADGSLGTETAAMDSRDYPAAQRTFTSPDGSRVLDDGGTVYTTGDLTYANTLGRWCDDVAFRDDGSCVVLRPGELVAYDTRLRETGRLRLAPGATRVFVSGGYAFTFTPPVAEGASTGAVRTELALLKPRPAAPAMNPAEAHYVPSDIVVGSDDIVYVLSRTSRNIFRWSAAQGRYLDPLPLAGVANHLAYSAAKKRLYVEYADCRIAQFDAAGVASAFVTVPWPLKRLLVAGNFIVAGSYSRVDSYGLAGDLVGPIDLDPYDQELAHDPVYQRLFYVDYRGLNSREMKADGTLGPASSLPYASGLDFRSPFRISPNGTTLGFGSGQFIAADSLTKGFSLAYPVDDLAWIGATVYSVRSSPDGTVVERWSGTEHARDKARVIAGTPVRLLALSGGRLLLVVMAEGAPVFVVLDSELQSTTPVAPGITRQPASGSVALGQSMSLSVGTTTAGVVYQWSKDGIELAGARSSSYNIADLQPDDAGLYGATLAGPAGASFSSSAVVGPLTTAKVAGMGTVVGADVRHPNGRIFDQVLVTGAAEAITADPGQVTRTSYVDLNDDIVQVEFSGAGTLSLVLAGASGPAAPLNYHQPGTAYMKGLAGIVIAGADETTNVSVFTVGRATAYDPTGAYNLLAPPGATNVPADNGSPLFQDHASTHYDGVADLAYIAILSRNGRFGGVRCANASFFAVAGLSGLYAPGVEFTGPVFLGDLAAFDSARPVLILGSATDTRITGGSLAQPNGRPVEVSGLTQLRFVAGTTSGGDLLPAQRNQARLEQNGTDVTSQVVVDP